MHTSPKSLFVLRQHRYGEKADHIPWEAPAHGQPGFRQFIDGVFAKRCSTNSPALKGTELACGFKVRTSAAAIHTTTSAVHSSHTQKQK